MAARPFHERREAIVSLTANQIEEILKRLLGAGFPFAKDITPLHLGSALAYNVAGRLESISTAVDGDSASGYLRRFSAEAAWDQVWAILVKPLGTESGNTPLSELACSVACEQRADWNGPDLPMPSSSSANQAFDFIYRRDSPKVRGQIMRTFKSLGADTQSIANEAWSRAFCDYWSTQARRRFLGLSRISTLVGQIAHFGAVDAVRARVRDNPSLETEPDRARLQEAVDQIGVHADPARGLMEQDATDRLRGCLKNLPVRQQLVAEMVLIREMPSKEIARHLSISEPAVSQHLKKAKLALRSCLECSAPN